MKKKVTKKKAHITGLQIRRLLIAVITLVVLFGIMSIAITPPRYDISVGQPAPNTIKASKDVSDLKTTERLRNEAAATVKSIYYFDDSASESLRGKLDMIFRSLRTVMTVAGSGSEPVWDSEANAGVALTDDELKIICAADENTLVSLETSMVSLATEALENKLDESHVEAALNSIREGLTSAKFDSKLVDAAMSILSQTLEPNYFYDAESTDAARQAERDKVAVVSRIKGEVIVSDGEIVTEAQYAMLAQLGMIKESSMDIYLYVGIGSIMLLLVLSSALYIKLFCKTVYANTKQLLMVAIICVLNVGACVIARTVTVYVMPVTLGMLMITILVQRRLALYLNLMLAIIASLLGSTSGSLVNMSSYSVFVCATVGGIVAHTILKNRQNRAGILLAGLLIGIANAATTFCVGLIASSNMMDSIICSGYAGCSGLLAAIICMAITPLFEVAFNAVTTTRLI